MHCVLVTNFLCPVITAPLARTRRTHHLSACAQCVLRTRKTSAAISRWRRTLDLLRFRRTRVLRELHPRGRDELMLQSKPGPKSPEMAPIIFSDRLNLRHFRFQSHIHKLTAYFSRMVEYEVRLAH